jgi:hypothetical protein
MAQKMANFVTESMQTGLSENLIITITKESKSCELSHERFLYAVQCAQNQGYL